MTSPCHSLTNFEDGIKLPSNPEEVIRIDIPTIYDDYFRATFNLRRISLVKEGEWVHKSEKYFEETKLTYHTIFVHLGDFNNDKIVKEFREDEIELI